MGYDAVFVFVDAMKRANSTDPAKFLPEGRQDQLSGRDRPDRVRRKGDLKNGPITIYVVKAGKWDTLEVVTPASTAAVVPPGALTEPPKASRAGTDGRARQGARARQK
jgi:branched-chain amino acid transport system substrate-binding protein